MSESPVRFRAPSEDPEGPGPVDRRGSWGDLAVAGGLALLGAIAALALPAQSVARFVLVLPAVLLVPGYLLLQVVLAEEPSVPSRTMQVLFSIGLSIAVVGLLALATAIVEGGFQAGPIIVLVTGTSLALAGFAFYRRSAGFEAASGRATG